MVTIKMLQVVLKGRGNPQILQTLIKIKDKMVPNTFVQYSSGQKKVPVSFPCNKTQRNENANETETQRNP